MNLEKQKKQFLFLVISLTFSLVLGNLRYISYASLEQNNYQILENDYIISGSVYIDENSDFTALGFPGSGTEFDPYRIENLKIETLDTYAMWIGYVDVYFVINGCYIDGWSYGIFIANSVSANIVIINTTIIDTNAALYLENLDNLKLINNTILGSGQHVADITACDGIEIVNNTFIDGEKILVENCKSAIIEDNTCTNTGFYISTGVSYYAAHSVNNNLVNGKILGFFANPQNLIISENIYGQIIVGDGDNVTIRDQVIGNTSISVSARYVQGLKLINNTFLYNKYYGVRIWEGDTIIEDCEIGYVEAYGTIDVGYTTNTIIRNCYLHDTGFAIIANGAENITSFNNNIVNTPNYGIRYQGSQNGYIYNNTMTNAGTAVLFYSFDFCEVAYNIIEDTATKYCVNVDENSNNNTFYYNFFLNNNLGGSSQVLDDGFNNTWYNPNTNTGNYYSDYSGSGDYMIDGTAGSIDPYVIIDSTNPIIVDKSENIEYSYGSTGNIIYWQTSDQHPRYYQILRNGSIVKTAIWRNTEMVYLNVDGLEGGDYNFTAVFYDMANNHISSEIIVSVLIIVAEYNPINILVGIIATISLISISSLRRIKK